VKKSFTLLICDSHPSGVEVLRRTIEDLCIAHRISCESRIETDAEVGAQAAVRLGLGARDAHVDLLIGLDPRGGLRHRARVDERTRVVAADEDRALVERWRTITPRVLGRDYRRLARDRFGDPALAPYCCGREAARCGLLPFDPEAFSRAYRRHAPVDERRALEIREDAGEVCRL